MKSIKRVLSAFLAMTMMLSVSAFAAGSTMTLQSIMNDSKVVDTVSLSNVTSIGTYKDTNGEYEVYYTESPTTVSFLIDTDNYVSYYCSGKSMDDYQKWINTGTPKEECITVESNTMTLTKAGVYSVEAYEKDGLGTIWVYVIVGGRSTAANSVTATPTASKVLVNGSSVSFDAYTINGNNYFKLRDLAKVLDGTDKQFEVSWDSTNKAINLESGSAYTAVGGELAAGDGSAKSAELNTSKIYQDGVEVYLTSYTINGNNYFKLRDIGKAFNFGVGWDGTSNTITIDT